MCTQGAQMIAEKSMTCVPSNPRILGFGQDGVAHTGQRTAGSRKSVWKTVESQPMHGHLTKTQFCGSVAKAKNKKKKKTKKKKKGKGKKKNRRKPETHSFPVFHHTKENKKHPQNAEKKSLKQAFSNGKWWTGCGVIFSEGWMTSPAGEGDGEERSEAAADVAADVAAGSTASATTKTTNHNSLTQRRSRSRSRSAAAALPAFPLFHCCLL